MLAAAAVIGYMDTRLPRDISVTLVRKDSEVVKESLTPDHIRDRLADDDARSTFRGER